MIDDRYVEEGIRRGLRAIAPDHTPGHILPDTFERTRRMAQDSRARTWLSTLKWVVPAVAATGATAIVIAIGLGFANLERTGPSNTLGSTVGALWTSDPAVAFSVDWDRAESSPLYWRGVAYDRIDARGLSVSATSTVTRQTNEDVLAGMADDVDATGRRAVTFTVIPSASSSSTVLSPGTPTRVDRTVRVTTVGRDGYVASIERGDGGPYTVTALVPDLGSGDLTMARLRAAGTSYPPEVLALFTARSPGVFGPNLTALRDEIVNTAQSRAPFDLAQRSVEVLQSSRFTYDLDVRDIDCGSMSTAECFATYRHGYCEHYAMTMAVILRDLGVPARVVEGYLPGDRLAGTRTELVRNSAAHAWVEVYFPGHGWVEFDPTGGGVPAQAPFGG